MYGYVNYLEYGYFPQRTKKYATIDEVIADAKKRIFEDADGEEVYPYSIDIYNDDDDIIEDGIFLY